MLYRFAAIVVLLMGAGVARADSWVVDPGGQGDVTCIADGIAMAAPGDTLLVQPGTYREALVLTKSLAILGLEGAESTVLDGNGQSRLLYVHGNLDCHLEGLWFRNGYETYAGGAVFANEGVHLYVRGCRFTGNRTAHDSGALRVGGVPTLLEMEDCLLEENYAPRGGAAVQVQFGAQATFRRCTFRNNLAAEIGGGLTVWQSSVIVDHCLFVGNQGIGAGAIHGLQAEVKVDNCTFHDNRTLGNGTITVEEDSWLGIHGSILASDVYGYGIKLMENSTWDHACNDYYQNDRGAISGSSLDPSEIQEDPLFNDPDEGDFTLQPMSPCLPENNDCGILMGAFERLTLMKLLSVEDVPEDEGGMVTVRWLADVAAPGRDDRDLVTDYVIQRNGGEGKGWEDVTSVPATGLQLYAVPCPTPDIYVVGQPEPASSYRVVSLRQDGRRVVSNEMAGFSVDDLPPEVHLVLHEVPEGILLCWNEEAPRDLAEVCIYRGEVPGFTPGDPVACSNSWCWPDEELQDRFYKARATDIHGNVGPWSNEVHTTLTAVGGAGTDFGIMACSPNPFNPRTVIAFGLDRDGPVRLAIHDLAGRHVTDLLSTRLPAGRHEVSWSGRDDRDRAVPAGVYCVVLESGGRRVVRKVMLLE